MATFMQACTLAVGAVAIIYLFDLNLIDDTRNGIIEMLESISRRIIEPVGRGISNTLSLDQRMHHGRHRVGEGGYHVMQRQHVRHVREVLSAKRAD